MDAPASRLSAVSMASTGQREQAALTERTLTYWSEVGVVMEKSELLSVSELITGVV